MTPTQHGDDRRLRELAEFLRHRRARLDPAALGLPVRARRRTPGLRREDVAERAGVSIAWYTSVEQGRPVNPSRRVVSALADALQLSDADRTHLHALTGHPAPGGTGRSADTRLLQQLCAHVDAPAYCTDALTHVIAWNALAVEVFGDYAGHPGRTRNLLRLLLEQPAFASRLVDREEYLARVVHTFRGRSDAYLQDPVAIDLVDDLTRAHPRFRQLWDGHDIRRTDTDTLQVDHPVGRLTLTLVNLQGVATPGTRFNAYLPADPTTRRRLDRISMSLPPGMRSTGGREPRHH